QRFAALADKDLLHEGFSPWPLECAYMSEHSRRLDVELQHVKVWIYRLRAIRDPSTRLNTTRDEAVEPLGVNGSIVAPVRRLPRELLAEIF
ncbi:hypothetical protein EV715DRAFT_165149, partial [Schizophyllum commune]